MQATDFPIGTVVELKSGGGKMTVIDNELDSAGHIKCACFALIPCFWPPGSPVTPGVQFVRLPPSVLVETSGDPADLATLTEWYAAAVTRNKVGVETLREAFKLRAGCDRVDHAAEDAAAEYRAYREQSAVDQRLEQSEALQRWRAAAASYPDAAARLAEGLRANGQDGDLRARASDLLEAFAR